jgi:hypothetical protein
MKSMGIAGALPEISGFPPSWGEDEDVSRENTGMGDAERPLPQGVPDILGKFPM